jgi:hypothetical protein
MSGLGAAAVVCARRGWHVFPLVPRRKVPLTRHGLLDASCDPELVAAWWDEQPRANIGIACGPSRLLVVDVDGERGAEAWTRLAGSNGGHPATLTAETGRGCHVYFDGPGGRSSAGKLGPGVDSRGVGGYVVCPPSVHESGGVYRWVDPEAPVMPVPGWLADALEPPPAPVVGERYELPAGVAYTAYGLAALAGLVDEMAAAVEGQRNHTLNAVAYRAGRLVAAGELAEKVAFDELIDAAFTSGLKVNEAGRTFESGFRAGLQLPAQVAGREPR